MDTRRYSAAFFIYREILFHFFSSQVIRCVETSCIKLLPYISDSLRLGGQFVCALIKVVNFCHSSIGLKIFWSPIDCPRECETGKFQVNKIT